MTDQGPPPQYTGYPPRRIELPPAAPGWYPHPQGGHSYWDGRQHVAYRPAPLPADKVTAPALGWVLLAAGAAVAVGAFMPWISALNGLVSRSGIDSGSDGWIALVLGLAIAGVGLTIGLKQGLLWTSIVATLLAVVTGIVAVVDINDVGNRGPGIEVGAGLYLIIIAAVATFILGVAGMFTRSS